jgi:predicted transcriptional regulator
MARKQSPTLTEAEIKLMDILWARGESTVAGVVAAFPRRGRPAYSTVLTILRILERKKYVTHRKEGRAFMYSPAVGRSDVRRGALDYVMSRFFNNSPELLMLKLMERKDMDAAELQRLKKRLEEEDADDDA